MASYNLLNFKKIVRFFLGLGILLTTWFSTSAQQSDSIKTNPFFRDTTLVSFELTLNFEYFSKTQKSGAKYLPAIVRYKQANSELKKIKIKFKTRPGARDSLNCSFPMLTLDFPKEKINGTPFYGLNKVKLVNPCHLNDSLANDYVLLEYAIYKSYQHLSTFNLKVRLAEITMHDSANLQPSVKFIAFFLQDIDEMAGEKGGKIFKVANVPMGYCDQNSMQNLSLFQYMIGNTNWSVSSLYNISFSSAQGLSLVPVPFEFSSCGLINHPSARPAPHTPITKVSERLYFGTAKSIDQLKPSITHFLNNKGLIMNEFINLTSVSSRSKIKALVYLTEFFETIANPESANIQIFEN